jgi:hypothetical protein
MAPRSDLDQRPAHDPDATRAAVNAAFGINIEPLTDDERAAELAELEAAKTRARAFYGHQADRP